MVLISSLNQGKAPAGYPQWKEKGVEWKFNPFLVVTPDRGGLLPTMKYLARTRSKIPELQPIVNRLAGSVSNIRNRARVRLGVPLNCLGLEEQIKTIDEDREVFGCLFTDTQPLPAKFDRVDTVLRLEKNVSG